jgi:hypothetical protein
MSGHASLIRSFFDAYAARMNAALADPKRMDAKAMRAAFADYFVGADANGVRGGKNGLLFRWMLPRGIKYYRRIGTLAMDLKGVQVADLDDHHAMAHVDWNARYKSGQEIAFTNIYLLQVRGGTAKIFAWITGDERRALKNSGVIE